MIPNNKPAMSRERVYRRAELKWLEERPGKDFPPGVFLVGDRGYFMDTMGKKGVNDRNMYDDALFIISPTVFASFNANVDPSAWRKGVASLKSGVHPYRLGNHGISRPGGGYPALRPATKDEELPVWRDGIVNPSPGVAINIHKGGYNTTSSLGCQTIYPSQWEAFIGLVKQEMKRYEQKVIEYILLETGR